MGNNPSIILPDIHGDFFLARKMIEAAKDKYWNRLGIHPHHFESIIQVGDFGIGKEFEKYDKKFNLEYDDCYMIHGNHEYFDKFNKYEQSVHYEDWNFVPAGHVIGKVLFIGGANSVDRDYRIKNNLPWYAEEEIDEKEKESVRKAIRDNDIEVVISHDCPVSFNMSYACLPQFGGEDKQDSCRMFLQEVLEEAQPRHWYFGHWHKSGVGEVQGCKWRCLGIPFDFEVCFLPLKE